MFVDICTGTIRKLKEYLQAIGENKTVSYVLPVFTFKQFYDHTNVSGYSSLMHRPSFQWMPISDINIEYSRNGNMTIYYL